MNLIVVGGGGHAKAVADLAQAAGYTIRGFLDDNPARMELLGYPRMGSVGQIGEFSSSARFVLGIGSNEVRGVLAGFRCAGWETLVHPTAIVGTGVALGEGTVVLANAVVNSEAQVGRHCIVNTGAVVEHDSWIGDFAHLSPQSVLCGCVRVGAYTQIGAGAVVANNLEIAAHCVIGAGSVVVRDILCPGIYVGNPARRISRGASC